MLRLGKLFGLLWTGVVIAFGPGCQTAPNYEYQYDSHFSGSMAHSGGAYQNPAIQRAMYRPEDEPPTAAPGTMPMPLGNSPAVPQEGPRHQLAPIPGPGPMGPEGAPAPQLPLPTEKAKTYHPPYIIEPPDVVIIDSIRAIPRPPYRIEPMDVLLIQVTPTLPEQPINGQFVVTPEGTVSLGFGYGVVRIDGMTLEQAAVAIRNFLKNSPGGIKDPAVSVSLVQFRAVQQVHGPHLVAMDGTVTLGSYGSVCITGLTLCQAKAAIERYLSHYLLNPEISISIATYNSKVFYVITHDCNCRQSILRFPITGNETVLDGIASAGGLQNVSSHTKIWVARPTAAKAGNYQILPVDWQVIVQAGDTATNYQLFPGDRIFIKADPASSWTIR
jgi:polysaccharide export outer membrane protein